MEEKSNTLKTDGLKS